jgi:hypothetical protein
MPTPPRRPRHNRVTLHCERLEARATPSTSPAHTAVIPANSSPAVAVNTLAPAAKAISTLNLAVSPSPAQVGQRVTLTATVDVYHSSVTPTSIVSFKDGSTALGTAWLDDHGVARLAIASLATGTHHFSAVYSGDGHVRGSQSPSVALTVTPPANPAGATSARVTLSNVGDVATSDASLMLLVAVTPAKGGSVTILDGTQVLGQLDLDRAGMTALSLPLGLSAGRHTLRVNYVSADGVLAGSGTLTLTLAQGESRW